MRPHIRDPLEQEFIYRYGVAMASWAGIEEILGQWFAEITGMPPAMARSVYFSAKNFNSRAEKLEAAIPHSSIDPDVLAALKLMLDKAIKYSSFRNRIAHGHVGMIGDASGTRYVLGESRNHPFDRFESGITVQQLIVAASNFDKLATITGNLMLDFIVNPSLDREPECTPQEYLEPVLMLPNQPDSETPSQKQLGQQRQRRSSRP